MLVPFKNAMETVDAFEELLASKNISIPKHPESGADTLSLYRILQRIKSGEPTPHEDRRQESTAGAAIHDLAAKVLKVQKHPDFEMLIPHLEKLADGAVHLTQQRQYESADTYNKLIELYWACLLMANDLRIRLDHPTHSAGDNPDVISVQEDKSRAYAFKTIQSHHTQSLLEHLKKGIEQIERCDADEGIVVFNLTPYILDADPWPAEGTYYQDWRVVWTICRSMISGMIEQLIADNGQAEIDKIFAGKKTVGSILCLAIFTTVAKNPLTGNPVAMPIKMAVHIPVASKCNLAGDFYDEVNLANHAMQQNL
ncbi:hypothetical protein [Sulfitobacter sp. 1A15106]|uniref:hypothetical protein n=1 Tax=Sulfitobacter sp. 1A15106 TaxID=3368590 RepID=UPI0037457DC1